MILSTEMLSKLSILTSRPLAVPSIYALRNKIALQSTVSTLKEKEEHGDNQLLNAKPFDEIPGPKGLPFIGSILDVLKNDRYYQKKIHLYFQMNAKKYGPIHKMNMLNSHTVFVYKPEDIAATLQAEGNNPNRGTNIPWMIYREQRKKENGLLTRLVLK